ncbi:MAG: hypothetical protein ACW99G_08610 [Candidatus Thorarchaeota archaeon]|jgi:hypothetical protein
MPVQAGLRFTRDNQVMLAQPGVAVTQWLEAWITASPQSGYRVYVDKYEFHADHYAYGLPGAWYLPSLGTNFETFELTFSGDGITTQTIELVTNGVFHSDNVPSWMSVEVLLNDPKGAEVTATLNVNQAFSMDASASMTVHAAGNGFYLLFGFIPIYVPYDSTYTVTCSAWYEDTGWR